MNRKIVAILIVIIIIGLLGFFLLSNQQTEKKKITLIVKTPVLQMTSYKDEEINDTYTFMQKVAKAFEEQYKDADVEVKVVQFAKADEDKQITGCFDTENATDVLFEEYFNMSTYVHSGKVVPLDDIITEDLRNDIDSSYWDNSMLNGKTYMMPYLGMQNTLSYNKELFRKAGLSEYVSDEDEVQNWSLDDWDTILSTLKKELPVNKYPMLMYAKNEMGDTHIMTLIRSRGCDFFTADGRVKIATPEGIEAVQWLMDCNEKGYFPANAENIEINDCFDLFMNGQLGIYITNPVLDVSIKESGVEYGNVNFPSIDGKGFNTNFLNGFEVFDNGDEDKLKVAKDFVKYIYETDEWLEYSAGAIPCSNKVALKYADELKEEQKYIDNNKQGWNFTANNPAWRDVRAIFYRDIRELLYGEMTAEEIAKQIEDDCNKAINKGYENSILHE